MLIFLYYTISDLYPTKKNGGLAMKIIRRSGIWLFFAFLTLNLFNADPGFTQTIDSETRYWIKASYGEKKLTIADESTGRRHEFSICVAKYKPKKFPITGTIRKAMINPAWIPTAATKRAYASKGRFLRDYYPPGSRGNAMGRALLVIDFDDPAIDRNIRIHGALDPRSIGTAASRGCIRMDNSQILSPISILSDTDIGTLSKIKSTKLIDLSPARFIFTE